MSRPLTVYEGDLLLLRRQAEERTFGKEDVRLQHYVRHGYLLALEELQGVAVPQAASPRHDAS